MPGRNRRAVFLLLCILSLALLPVCRAYAAEDIPEAQDISRTALVTDFSGFHYCKGLFDKQTAYALPLKEGACITLSDERGIASLYLIFGTPCEGYTVTDPETGAEQSWGGKGILHEFLDLEEAFGNAPATVTLNFPQEEVRLAEIYAFTSGEVPGFVQKWEMPVEQETDLVLFATHGDDEQLFFAGLLPYYAGELGYQVQVVYLTDHHNNSPKRMHEMLNGLWAVGVKTYPVFGTYWDFYSESLKDAYKKYASQKITQEELVGFALEQLRRFRPKVAVGHDLAGEYGHGMHMLYADILCRAAEISGDPGQYPELAEKYGVWDVPKVYLHLYEENAIVMDWDQPLEHFGGKTAYEVTRDLGFPAHISQRYYYSSFFRGSPRASMIREYSPCQYGLYMSTVGPDVQKNDFFENLTTYAQDGMDERELIRMEQDRQKAEKEAEQRRQEEEAKRLAEEQRKAALLQAEQERLAAEIRQKQEEVSTRRKWGVATPILLGGGLLLAAGLLAGGGKSRRNRNRKNN